MPSSQPQSPSPSLAGEKPIDLDALTPRDEAVVACAAEVFLARGIADVKMNVYSVEKAAEVWAKNKFGAYNVMILFRDVNMIKKSRELGVNLDEISLGQMSITGDRVQIHRTFGLSESEAQTLLDLERDGVNIYFQMTPMDGKENLDVLRSKIPGLK